MTVSELSDLQAELQCHDSPIFFQSSVPHLFWQVTAGPAVPIKSLTLSGEGHWTVGISPEHVRFVKLHAGFEPAGAATGTSCKGEIGRCGRFIFVLHATELRIAAFEAAQES